MKQIPLLKIEIRNQTDEEAVIDIDGEIGGFDWEDWKAVNTPKIIKEQLKKISALKSKKIIVNINSLGGFVDDGLAIHDILAQHPAEIETNVIGFTASAATVIAQAGDVRKISDNALYLVHRAWGGAIGNVFTFQQAIDDLNKMDDRILNIYTKRSGNDQESIEMLMNENEGGGKWIDAKEALDYGLVDEVFEPMKAAAAVDPNVFNKIGLPLPEGFENPTKYQNTQIEADKLRQEIQEEAERLLQEMEKTDSVFNKFKNKKRVINNLRLLI